MSAAASWSPTIWGLLIGTPVLVSFGQVLFKVVGQRWSPEAGLLRLVLDPVFACSMAVYAAATLSWIVVLRTVPLGLAYTFTALGFALVPALSMLFFGEALGMRYAIGVACIVAGLLFIHA